MAEQTPDPGRTIIDGDEFAEAMKDPKVIKLLEEAERYSQHLDARMRAKIAEIRDERRGQR